MAPVCRTFACNYTPLSAFFSSHPSPTSHSPLPFPSQSSSSFSLSPLTLPTSPSYRLCFVWSARLRAISMLRRPKKTTIDDDLLRHLRMEGTRRCLSCRWWLPSRPWSDRGGWPQPPTASFAISSPHEPSLPTPSLPPLPCTACPWQPESVFALWSGILASAILVLLIAPLLHLNHPLHLPPPRYLLIPLLRRLRACSPHRPHHRIDLHRYHPINCCFLLTQEASISVTVFSEFPFPTLPNQISIHKPHDSNHLEMTSEFENQLSLIFSK